MRALIGSLAMAVFILGPLSTALAQAPATSEEDLVRQSFKAYKDAILLQSGPNAVPLVNKATLDYYGRMKDLALDAPETQVRRLGLMDKLMVLSLRVRVPAADLRAMSPAQILAHGVDQGWIGKESVMDSDIGTIQVRGEEASAQYVKGGRVTSMLYRFTRENGRWKVDLTALLPPGENALGLVIVTQHLDPDEFIVDLLESVTGAEVSDSVWQPPGDPGRLPALPSPAP